MLDKRSQIYAELEATEGTAETEVVADFVYSFDHGFEPIIEPHKRDAKGSSLSPHASVFGKRGAKMTFKSWLFGTAAAGTANHLSDVLLTCGMSETLVGATSATYKPASSSISAATLARYIDGKIYKMWGARGNMSLSLAVGEPGIFSFDFSGADFSEADGALLSPTIPTVLPPVFQNATLTLDTYAATVEKVELNLNNVIAARPDANSSSGVKSFVITDRAPTMTIDIENLLVATKDWLAAWRSGTQMAFSAVFGSVAGNTLTITAPKAQFQDLKLAERDGVSILQAELLLARNAGDDELSIAVT